MAGGTVKARVAAAPTEDVLPRATRIAGSKRKGKARTRSDLSTPVTGHHQDIGNTRTGKEVPGVFRRQVGPDHPRTESVMAAMEPEVSKSAV
jgi:hypothetical protein